MKSFKGKIFIIILIGIFAGAFILLAGGTKEEPEKEEVKEMPKEKAVEKVEPVETIKIGCILSLTGSAARAGQEAKDTFDLAVDVINNKTPGLKGIPLAETAGLPNLGGAKIEVIYGDHQGKPEIAMAETERLLTVENVIAFTGFFHSSCCMVGTEITERAGIPSLIPDSTMTDIMRRGFKWIVRTTPINETYVRDAINLIDDFQKKYGTNYKRVVISVDTTLQGKSFGDAGEEGFRKAGYEVVGRVGTPTDTTDVTADMLKIKSMEPEILYLHHYLQDMLLLAEACKKYDVNPKVYIGVSNYYSYPDFIQSAKDAANFYITPGTFPPKFIGTNPLTATVNELFKKKYGRNIGDGRQFIGLIILADAINRAGSTDPQAIMKALRETNLTEKEIVMPWKGVKFDSNGENMLASITYQQILDGQFEIVWPLNFATVDVVWPAPAWKER